MNEIMKQKTAEEIAYAYQNSKQKIEQAYKLLAEAEKEMTNVLGDSVGYSGIYTVDRETTSAWNREKPQEIIDSILHRIRAATWRRIVERLGIREIMSSKERDKLDEKLTVKRMCYDRNGKQEVGLEEPTIENIMNLFLHYTQSAPDKLNELIKETFDILRPRPNWRPKKALKTNSRFKIGKKVILEHWITGYFSRRDDDIFTIDRCFHILDGKRAEGYRGPLNDAIGRFGHYGHDVGGGETEYFRFTVYQNGNLHLEFKRMDLVNKINEIGGNGSNELGKGKGK